MAAPAPPALDRFRDEFASLPGEPGRLGVAVSGGADSLALLLLAAAGYPGQVEAATVDHGLRPESRSEAESVAELCRGLGVPHEILAVSVPDGKAGIQGEAREARYGALAVWCKRRGLPVLLTAHHCDDQAETLLMRLQRGAGLPGLTGIRPARKLAPGLLLLRPLLGWSKDELREIVREAGIDPVDDPTNRDPAYDRTRIRTLLTANPDLDPRRLARSIKALREADEALDWMAESLSSSRMREEKEELVIEVEGLPREMRRRLLVQAIGRCQPGWKGGDVEGLLQALESGSTATLAGLKASGGRVWRLGPAPPRRAP